MPFTTTRLGDTTEGVDRSRTQRCKVGALLSRSREDWEKCAHIKSRHGDKRRINRQSCSRSQVMCLKSYMITSVLLSNK